MDWIPQIVVIVFLIAWSSILTYLLVQQRFVMQNITRGGKKESILDILNEVLEKEKRMEVNIKELHGQVEGLIFDSQFYIQKIGLVRFNPFNDTGGDQSFILALIDDQNSGVVISGLHTRNGTRWYAKKVEDAKGVEHELSIDEVKAIKVATRRVRK